MKTLQKYLATTLLMLAGTQAQAIMVTDWTHNSGSTPADYTLSVSESMDRFLFSLSIDMGFDGDLLALGLNGLDYNAMNLDVMGADITGTYFDTLACGTGCNFNGDGSPSAFDVIIKFGVPGSDDGIVSTSFSIAKLGFSLEDFEGFGVRAQATGTSGCVDEEEAETYNRNICGSDKAYGAYAETPVPEPSALLMLGLGIIGLGTARWLRRG